MSKKGFQGKCGACDVIYKCESDKFLHERGKKHLKNMTSKNSKRYPGIYVTGFSDSTTFQQLIEYFGKIAQIYGYSRKTEMNYALISFKNHKTVNKILKKKHVINGQPVSIARKVARPEHRLSVPTTSTESNHQETKKAAIKKLFDSKNLELKGNFNEQLMYLISQMQLNPQQVGWISLLYTDLEDHLGVIFPGCRARPFGSLVTGLGTIYSDVDCFIELSGNVMPKDTSKDRITLQRKYIRKAKSVFYRYHRTYETIRAIPRASTPIIKFFHIPTQSNCGINFKDCIGVLNSDLIRFLLSFDERLLPLFIFLKYLMKYYDISGRSQFTNYALTMMTFFYLQQPPSIIPPIHDLQKNCKFENIQDLWNCGFEQIEIPKNDNKMSITELLEGFFTFYKDFDYKNSVISPYVGSAVHVSKFESLDLPPELDLYKRNLDFDKPKIKCNMHITVQDPFCLCHNTTSDVGNKSLNKFLHICESASAICAKAHATDTTNTLIKNLLDISVASTRGPRVALELPYVLPQLEPVGLAAIAQLDTLSAKMKDFIGSALSKILTCTIREEEGKGRRTSYYCELHHPIWESRDRFPELSENKNVLEANIAISERIVSSAEKSQLLFSFYIDFEIKEIPKVIMLHILPGSKQNVNNYGEFVHFCQQNIIGWYDKFISLNATEPNNDANKSLKRSIEPLKVMSSEETDKKALKPEDKESREDSPPEKVSKISIDANSVN